MTTMPETTWPEGAPGRFDVASRITHRGEGTYHADLDAGLSVGDKLNGGYLLAVLVRAALAELRSTDDDRPANPGKTGDTLVAPDKTGDQPAEMNGARSRAADPDGARADLLPVASTAHYLANPHPGPAQVLAEVLRRGRSTGQVRARLRQEGVTCVEAVVTFARPGQVEPWREGPVVDLPPERDCFLMPPQVPGAPFDTPIMGVVEERLDPGCLAFAAGRPDGTGQLRGWLRIPGSPAVDAAGLILAADALPPAAFTLGYLGWVPTLSLTVHLIGLPVPGPLRIRQQVRGLDSGVLTQVCDIWDDADRLVAHAVQLATLPR